jgi:predicted CXXCH cytochrome family protein
MFIRKICLIILALLAFRVSAEGDQNIIKVIYPPDGTVMEYGVLSVSLNIAKNSADVIKISINDKEKLEITPDREFVCFSVGLSAGINRISIAAIRDKKEADRIVINVFRRSDLERAYKNTPDGFKKNYFHTEYHEQCAGCHVLKAADIDKKPINVAAFPTEKFTLSDLSRATSTCFSCHKSLTAYPFIHGPASVWSCLSCHESGAERVYAVRKPDTKVCFGCHIEQKSRWERNKYQHGPFTTGNCTICHSPHASENPFNLHKPTWDLCINCHPDKGSGEHVVAALFGSYFHPTRGKPDPLRPGQELSCTSCHDPHASDAPKLWRLNVGSGFELCRKCHAD